MQANKANKASMRLWAKQLLSKFATTAEESVVSSSLISVPQHLEKPCDAEDD